MDPKRLRIWLANGIPMSVLVNAGAGSHQIQLSAMKAPITSARSSGIFPVLEFNGNAQFLKDRCVSFEIGEGADWSPGMFEDGKLVIAIEDITACTKSWNPLACRECHDLTGEKQEVADEPGDHYHCTRCDRGWIL